MKTLLFMSMAVALLVGGVASAQEESPSNAVTIQDLGVESTGLLPTSPLYIFKEIGRDLRRFVTFNPVSRAELELKITNEKAAEAKKVEESGASDQAIARALANYESAQERLKTRLEALRETSENPNIDRLLTEVTERSVLHERLLSGLEDRAGSEDQMEAIRKRIAETIEKVAEKDTPERLKERFERVFDEAKGDDLKDLDAVDLLNRLQNVPEDVKEKIFELREEAATRLQDRLENAIEAGGGDQLRERLLHVVGNSLERTGVLEELRLRASDAVADVLERAQEGIQSSSESSGVDIALKAKEQIAEAERYLAKVKSALSGSDVATEAVRQVIAEAERNLGAAMEAYRAGEYRKAFEFARTALAALRSVEARVTNVGSSEPVQILERVRTQLQQLVPAPLDQTNTGSSDGTVCTLEYNPVCGSDGETYSNECFARASGARISSKGACGASSGSQTEPNTRSLNVDQLRTQVAEPLRALDILRPSSSLDNE